MISPYSIIFLLLGMLAVVLFHESIYIPIWMSVSIFMGVSIYLLQKFRSKRLGVLMLLLWLVYSLPFIHIVPYLWFDFDSDTPLILWGLAVNPYMLDALIIKLTAMIGAVGGLGFAFGVSLYNKKIDRDISLISEGYPNQVRALSTPVWIVWVTVGVALSWLAAPQETLFTAAYLASESALENANFSSAWIISYVLLSFALCDAILDRNLVRKAFKQQAIFWAIVFVVVFLQLLRGNRESVPFVFGALLVYFYWAAPLTQRRQMKLPWVKIIVGGFVLVIMSMIVGAVRHSPIDIKDIASMIDFLAALAESDVIGISNLLNGTWSGVLLTPLSVAGDHINGLLPLKLGQDYLDLLLSIPPGFIADAVGYTRPLDSLTGPAWEMRYGLGGTHASVVPFLNFRMIGVFLIPALWAYIFTGYEEGALKRLNAINLSFLCTAVMASPHWLWYGDKAAVNALIIWFVLSLLYIVSETLSDHSKVHVVQSPLQDVNHSSQ